MSIDKDDKDKFEGHEESEYHFSDEDVNANYEVDETHETHETHKEEAPAATGESKESFIKRLTGSKRMLISLGVFLVLVFVVYKMVGQSTSVPATDIGPVVVAQPATMPATATQATPVASAPAQAQPVAAAPTAPTTSPEAVAAPAVAQTAPAVSVPTATVAQQQPVAQTVVQPIEQLPQQAQQAQQVQQAQTAPQQQATTVVQQLPVTTTVQAQPAAPAQIPTQAPATQNAPVVSALPSVIPVQTSAPAYDTSSQAAAPSMLSSMGAYIDAKSEALNANSQKAIEQLQGQYAQKFNDFTNQNKALQDQVQTLSSRVAAMESQLNQLVQVLTRRNQVNTTAPANPPPPPPPFTQNDIRIGYTVQAIIPGRAWLKADNGETVTVAEGDMVKEVGRVSKIDPYDGVVEINTGTKLVSLSYGNGG